MSIYKVNDALPISTKISEISSMVLELEGLIEQAKFNLHEIESVYSGSGLYREFRRDESLGHTVSTYANWSHLHAEDSYSIWKYSPTNYEYNAKNKLYFDDKAFDNRGEADSESALAFTKVYLYDGSYNDHTTAAGVEGDTAIELMSAASDYLYVGYGSAFQGISFEFDTRGSNYALLPQIYHSGASAWVGLTSEVDTLSDQTSNFSSDGRISWSLAGTGSGWSITTVNAQNLYWVRLKTTTVPVTVAEADLIEPSNSVITLLMLSGDEVLDEDWAWCSYGSSVYVTLRNKGASAYEGSYYITSSSSDANKQNYFIYNHELSADYRDSAYVQQTIRLRGARTIASGASGHQGDVYRDAGYLYVATSENTWKRIALSNFA